MRAKYFGVILLSGSAPGGKDSKRLQAEFSSINVTLKMKSDVKSGSSSDLRNFLR